MSYPNFSTTVDAIESYDPARGTKLLQHLSDVMGLVFSSHGNCTNIILACLVVRELLTQSCQDALEVLLKQRFDVV